MILKCLVVFVLIETVSSSDPDPRRWYTHRIYRYVEPISNRQLTCWKCPPGSVLYRKCTHTMDSVCTPCAYGYYSKILTKKENCTACIHCGANEHETQICTRTLERKCECNADYFRKFGSCERHTKCTYGHGAVIPGTPTSDSTCEECTSGFYSQKRSSKQQCTAHTICQGGLVVNVPGNIYHDTLCTSCNKYVGTSDSNTACDDALIQFVAYQKIAKINIETFLRSLNTENIEGLLGEMLDLNTNMMYTMLYPLLVKWRETVNGQPVPQLMISVLERADLNDVVVKVQSRFW